MLPRAQVLVMANIRAVLVAKPAFAQWQRDSWYSWRSQHSQGEATRCQRSLCRANTGFAASFSTKCSASTRSEAAPLLCVNPTTTKPRHSARNACILRGLTLFLLYSRLKEHLPSKSKASQIRGVASLRELAVGQRVAGRSHPCEYRRNGSGRALPLRTIGREYPRQYSLCW